MRAAQILAHKGSGILPVVDKNGARGSAAERLDAELTRSGEQVMELFAQLHSEGVTIVMITHEPEIARHAQRIVTIRDGMLEQGGFGERRTEQEGDAS